MNLLYKLPLLTILSLLLSVLTLTSCDPDAEYTFVIDNNSSSEVKLEFDTTSTNTPEINPYAKIVISGEVKKKDWRTRIPLEPIEILKPQESASFIYYVPVTNRIQDNPEDDGVIPLWNPESRLIAIYVDDEELPVDIWRNRNNWRRQNSSRFMGAAASFILSIE
ncbi:MAG: hypothetical protein NC212_00315 [Staphylococcus sp.]|nr:hypothetical protein [Staphylococcus sp.]